MVIRVTYYSGLRNATFYLFIYIYFGLFMVYVIFDQVKMISFYNVQTTSLTLACEK